MCRILLDEHLPVDFAKMLAGREVATVHSQGWSGINNGDLMRRASSVCDVFVTLDLALIVVPATPYTSALVTPLRGVTHVCRAPRGGHRTGGRNDDRGP